MRRCVFEVLDDVEHRADREDARAIARPARR
jgi:hypothetical protein